MPKTSSGGQSFRHQDIKKSRGRDGKLRQKKADRRKKKNLETRKTPTFSLVFLGRFYHLTENYYIINSETIMDVNNYIPFSIINPQTIDVM